MKTKKNTKTDKPAKNAKNAKKPAVKCALCGAEIKGHGNNPDPLATEGVCCDECNVKVLAERAKLAAEADKKAAKKAYALEYYKKNADKIRESSRRSHAKRNAEAKELMNGICDMLLGIASERDYDWFAKYGDPSLVTRLAAFLKREA